MNRKIILISVIAVFLLTGGYAVYHFAFKKSTAKEENKKSELYVCPMHPQIQSDHPSTCPICGMDLVLKPGGGEHPENKTVTDIGELTLSPSEQVLANVKTQVVSRENFDFSISANGVVKSRDDASRQISSPVKGKITRLYVNYEGQKIVKGQKAFEVYSPELIATQREYLLAWQNYQKNSESSYKGVTESAASVLEAARQRLKLWFVSDNQIEELQKSGNIQNSLTYYSGYSGVVTKKYVNEGSWVMEGAALADIVDLSSVWVMASIYEYELPGVKIGQTAGINASGFGPQGITGKIDYINPFVNADTRTVEVRITVPNRGFALKPEMYVKINISGGELTNAVTVPKTAVLRTGKMDMVYVKKSENTFVPRNVEISAEKDGKYLVKSGLEEGEEVVVSAGFLLDSESRIKMGGTTSHEGMDMPGMKNDTEIKDRDAMKDMKNKNNGGNKDDMKNMQHDMNKMEKDSDGKEQVKNSVINIPSAQCDICKDNITRALNRVKGIKSFEVDVDNKIVRVSFDAGVTGLGKIEKAITLAGYDANNKKADPVAYGKLDNCCKKPEDRKKKE